MQYDLVTKILEHPTPERIWKEVVATLEAEKTARAAFREWLKPDTKAEFISGEIIMHSPAKRRHNQATKHIASLIDLFISTRNLGEVAIEKALIELTRHDVEPDICFWNQETADGFNDDMNVYPPPDLVVEVLSKSTEGRDRGVKKDAYEADGVREYWLVDPQAQTVEVYELAKNKHGRRVFVLRETYGVEQMLVSPLLPGFSVSLRAFFEPNARDAAVRNLLAQ
jgi:Uma2 family endonuclease